MMMVSFKSALLTLACCLVLVAGEPAQPCDQALCTLPNCRCASEDIPGNLAPEQTPQIVTISMDDGIRVIDYEDYYSQFLNVHTNPNNCPIQGTFFVSHQFTDYSLMERIVSEGHEIADHSVTHREPISYWTEGTVGDWTREIADLKTISERWGNVPENHIRGFRAPFLAVSENEMRALHNENFTYEASMPSRTQYWPFTLDYKSPLCDSPALCPDDSYPGLWLVPTPFLEQANGVVCGMLDSCTDPEDRDQWLALLRDNFSKRYRGNRAPFGLYMHASWFYHPGDRLAALNQFLSEIGNLDDVYVVSQQKMLDWVRNPTPLSDIASFEPWSCPSNSPPRCDYQTPTICEYDPEGVEVLNVCDECPSELPALGNPLGLDPAALAALTSSSLEVMPTSTSSVEVASSSEVQLSMSVTSVSSDVVTDTSSETSEPGVESTSTGPPMVSSSAEPPMVSSSTEPPVVSSSTEPPVESSSTEPPVESSSTEPPVVSSSTEPPVVSTSTEPPVVSTSTESPVESSSTALASPPVVDSSSQLVLSSSPVTETPPSTSQPPEPTNPPTTEVQNGTGAPQSGDLDTTLISAIGAGVGGAILLTIIGALVVIVLVTLWVKRGRGKLSRYSYRYGGRRAAPASDALSYRNPDII